MSFGIRSQLVLGLFSLLSVAVAIAALLFVYLIEGETESQVMSEQRERALLMSRALESLCPKLPCQEGTTDWRRSDTHRFRAGVIDPNGHLWFGQVHESDRRSSEVLDAFQSRSLSWQRIEDDQDLARLTAVDQRVVIPLTLTSGQPSAIVARFSLEHVRLALAERRNQAFLYLALDFLAVLLFGLYLSGQTLVRPLTTLTQSVTRLQPSAIASEAIDLPAVRGPAEIERLGRAFTELIVRLEASRAELAQSLMTLESTRDELVRSEKLATVGRLAASVAHEVGNPLAAVVGYLDYLRGETELDPKTLADLHQRMDGELTRIRTILRRLLDYSRPTKAMPMFVHVDEVIRSAIESHDFQTRFQGIVVEVSGSAPPAFMDSSRLHQVFVNLFTNAADAMGNEGRIMVELGEESGGVIVRVRDFGPGIAADQVEQVFEPFFTTKLQGVGTGLGLAISRRLVEEGGGKLTLEPQTQGACFILELPKTETALGVV